MGKRIKRNFGKETIGKSIQIWGIIESSWEGEGAPKNSNLMGGGGQNTRQPFTQGNEQEKVKTKAEKGN